MPGVASKDASASTSSSCAKHLYCPRQTGLKDLRTTMKTWFLLTIKLALFGLLVLGSTELRAGCTCVCVDGVNRPLCASITDRKPLCPPRVCPREPYTTRPLDQPGLETGDPRNCERKLVRNKYSGRYEWWKLCN